MKEAFFFYLLSMLVEFSEDDCSLKKKTHLPSETFVHEGEQMEERRDRKEKVSDELLNIKYFMCCDVTNTGF